MTPLLSPKLIVGAFRARPTICTRCGSDKTRPSGHHTPVFARLVGLRVFRCETCLRTFLSRRGSQTTSAVSC